MAKYFFDKDAFVIEDYQNAKKFSSFLPAIAGIDGKPLWAFYANVGQCMGGFGIDSKDTPMTPFDSAVTAYQNIPTKSFRTFCKIDGKDYAFFEGKSDGVRSLKVRKSNIEIVEENDSYKVTIVYSTVSHRDYPGLVRYVNILNKDNKEHAYQICDGLPVYFPLGLSNFGYKDLSTLMSAYCLLHLNNNAPYYEFKSANTDNSVVEVFHRGNGYITMDQNGKRLDNVVELLQIFNTDAALINPISWNEKGVDILKEEQLLENHIPCAFSLSSFTLKAGESYEFSTLFSSFESIEKFNKVANEFSLKVAKNMIKETEELVNSYLPKNIHTGSPIFDEYIRQCYLDNYLRGGFPIMLDNKGKGEPYYIFSRKHGDMERDYNAFKIPSTYFSSGPGHFRDVNQNRRSDLYFVKDVEDYNIKTFFSLIQMDGQNPLTVNPNIFKKNDNFDAKIIEKTNPAIREELDAMLTKGSHPGKIYTLLKDNTEGDISDLYAEILSNCHQEISATYTEGYWVDHWTYNVDLLENYLSVYPDKMEDLLWNNNDYQYYHSLSYVNPRSEKYCLVGPNKIRQYGTLNLEELQRENEEAGLKGDETLWKCDQNNNIIKVNLATKIFNLILVKFSCLDAHQMGIEMESERPGWNDACNGLPGLFASAMSETVELVRLIDFALANFTNPNGTVSLTADQKYLYDEIKDAVANKNKLSKFEYWDKVTTAREVLRKNTHFVAKNNGDTLNLDEVITALNEMKAVLSIGIKEAIDKGNGIIPSYIINDISKYEITDKVNHLGYKVVKPLEFKQRFIPHFLEASARLAKLGKEFFTEKEYQAVYKSDLRDQVLGFYKTCEDIDDAPFEIGRIHQFSKGWLERECNFLHMTYKYLLGLIKAGLYKEFYEELKVNFVCNMDPEIYGRSPLENSSFIVPTCNPNKKIHGQGQYARLTGANAEVLDIFYLMFLGEHAFSYKNNVLSFTPSPKLDKSYFDDNDEVSFPLFNTAVITYHNKDKINTYEGCKLTYFINDNKYDCVEGELAEDIRNGKITKVYIEISK